MRRRPPFSAFTLLELIIVMLIFAIVTAIAAPVFTGYTQSSANDDMATRIVTLARYAHTESVTQARAYRLYLDPGAGQFWLAANSGADYQPPSGDFGDTYTVPDGTTLWTDLTSQDGKYYVQFDPNGLVDQSPVKIRFTDRRGDVSGAICPSSTEPFRVANPGEITQ